jgi:Na+/proline symporter
LWSRATGSAAIAGSAAGLIGAIAPGWIDTGSFAEGVELATFPGAIPTLAPFFWALVISTAVMVGVSLAARRETDLGRLAAAQS